MNMICPLVYNGTISIAIFAGNETSVNNLGEQMDIEIKEPADYEVPDPPSMMRMKENEAYGIDISFYQHLLLHNMKSLLGIWSSL